MGMDGSRDVYLDGQILASDALVNHDGDVLTVVANDGTKFRYSAIEIVKSNKAVRAYRGLNREGSVARIVSIATKDCGCNTK